MEQAYIDHIRNLPRSQVQLELLKLELRMITLLLEGATNSIEQLQTLEQHWEDYKANLANENLNDEFFTLFRGAMKETITNLQIALQRLQ